MNKTENTSTAPKTSDSQTAPAKNSGSKKEDQPSSPEIESQGNIVRELKLRKAPKEEVQAAIDELVRLKAVAAQSTAPVAEKPKAESNDAKKNEPKAGKKDAKKEEAKADGKKPKAQEEGSKKSQSKAKEEKVSPVETGKIDDKKEKACLKEGGKKGQDIAGMATFGVHFFCVTVETAEGDMKLLEKVLEGMNAEVDPEAEDRKGGAGDLGKMLFNANEHKLVILCHTPSEVLEKATAAEWMEGVLKVTNATVTEKSDQIIKAEIANDPDKGVFTLKLRDEAMSASFAFLRSKQLMIEDDSDDDVNYAAAAGINLNAAPGADY